MRVSENRVLREVSGYGREGVTGENCVVRRFVIFTVH
jgi:hypothetical protein